MKLSEAVVAQAVEFLHNIEYEQDMADTGAYQGA
jgi:hypothetical protein